MQVTRVTRGAHSWIEPPLGESWDHLTKLQWKAAAVGLETDLRIDVHGNAASIQQEDGEWQVIEDTYNVVIKGAPSMSAYGFHDAWTLLNGISAGARAVS